VVVDADVDAHHALDGAQRVVRVGHHHPHEVRRQK
jgi:hypothetical protein